MYGMILMLWIPTYLLVRGGKPRLSLEQGPESKGSGARISDSERGKGILGLEGCMNATCMDDI